jgi:hypothetical protein
MTFVPQQRPKPIRSYCTVPVSTLTSIDYSQVRTSSADSATRNVANDTAIISWNDDMPATVTAISSKGATMTHAETLTLLDSEGWVREIE